jgi:acetylornithine deacetylase/succinyl-diaminopimelate desuccinylase-like protein
MSAEGITPDNACKPATVYFMMRGKGKPQESLEAIEAKLNEQVSYAKDNPKFKAKPAVQFVVNCRGELGGAFHMVTESGSQELDAALIAFFKTLTVWKPASISGAPVDSWYMWRLSVKGGRIAILD